MTLQQMLERRSQLIADAQQLRRDAETRGGPNGISDEDAARIIAVLDEADTLTRSIESQQRNSALAQRISDFESRLGQPQNQRSNPLPHNDPVNTRNGRHGYSLLRAISHQIDGRPLTGIEAETHEELRRINPGAKLRGFLMPWDLECHGFNPRTIPGLGIERRDLDHTTGAGALQKSVSQTMIEVLRSSAVFPILGATVLTGMDGVFDLPKQAATSTAYWVSPGSNVTSSNATIPTQVEFAPKSIAGRTAVTRRFVKQVAFDAEMWIRNDLALTLALGLDAAGFEGSGTGPEPLGLLNDTDIPTIAIGANGGDPTWSAVVKLESSVAAANALLNSLAYVTSFKGRGKMKETPKANNTAGIMLWNENENRVNGYTATASNQIRSDRNKGTSTSTLTSLVFGNWKDATFSFWGGADVVVNPYTLDASGAYTVTAFQDCDFHVVRGGSFAKCLDLQTQ